VLGISALLEPGVTYVIVLVMAGLFAAMVRLPRLVYFKGLSRTAIALLEIVFWLAVITAATGIGAAFAMGAPPRSLPGPRTELPYFVIHITVVAFAFRRAYGLLRARFAPPSPDRRRTSSALRILEGVLLLVLLYSQFALAVLFGVMGPHRAKGLRPAAVVELGESGAPVTKRILLIERTDTYLTGYDTEKETVVQIPSARILRIEIPPHNTRLQPAASRRSEDAGSG
jgi:hypothetical protein